MALGVRFYYSLSSNPFCSAFPERANHASHNEHFTMIEKKPQTPSLLSRDGGHNRQVICASESGALSLAVDSITRVRGDMKSLSEPAWWRSTTESPEHEPLSCHPLQLPYRCILPKYMYSAALPFLLTTNVRGHIIYGHQYKYTAFIPITM